jgi:DNA-binding transcriptional regulator WhiA
VSDIRRVPAADPHRVPRPERELVAALRAELAAVEPSRPCDRAAERAGLGRRPRPGDQPIARLVHRLGEASEEGTLRTATDWATAPDHCRIAWLRGRFLASGSLSLASGRTHLEFVVPLDEAPELGRRLVSVGLPASSRSRRGRGVVTWKSAETVGTFLRLIGAGAALLELEARQVARALRGDLNRVINAESANLQRAVTAAGRQLAAIERLDADGVLGTQPYVVRLVADGRRETPEATLSELAERLGVHRSAVQRALERIEWLVLHEAAAERPSRRGRVDRGRRASRGPTRSRPAAGGRPAPLS